MSLPPQKISDLPKNPTPPATSEIELNNSGTSESTTLSAVVVNYQLLSEKNQINGYAGLDGSAEISQAQIPVLPQSKIVDLETDLAARELIANKGAISGYAGLDASQLLLLANYPAGTALQVLRRNAGNTALEFATTGGITSINGDGTAAQIIQGTLNRITVNDTGPTHTLDIGTNVVTLTGNQILTNKTLTAPVITYTINAQSGTSYTLLLSDAKSIITSNNASPVIVTIPPNSDVAFDIGSSVTIISIGVGLTSIAGGIGVTITSTGSVPTVPVLRTQHSSATVIKTATDTWRVVGDIS